MNPIRVVQPCVTFESLGTNRLLKNPAFTEFTVL